MVELIPPLDYDDNVAGLEDVGTPGVFWVNQKVFDREVFWDFEKVLNE